MLNFRQIVETLLYESELKNAQGFFAKKIPSTSEQALTQIYNLLASSDRYIAGEKWEEYLEHTPIFNAVVEAGGGSYQKIRDAIKANNISNIEDFYSFINNALTASPDIANKIKPLDQGFDPNSLLPDVKSTYDKAFKQRTKSVLVQNVYPTLVNETVVNSLLKIFENRLTGLERLKIKMNMLGSKITDKRTPLLEALIKDIFNNIQTYSSGKKPANTDIINVLQSINISYEDLITLGSYVEELYKLKLAGKFPNYNKGDKTSNMQKAAYDSSLTPENIYLFAKDGILQYNVPGKGLQKSNIYYNLKQIESENTNPGNEIIKIIKSISTGIREKEGFSQKAAAATSALQSVAAFGGAKLYT
jgi:hypothetical protein